MAYLLSPPISADDRADAVFKEMDVTKQELSLSTSPIFCSREDDPPDMSIISLDGIIFLVHRQKLLEKSTNWFANLFLLEDDQYFAVLEPADIVNLLLHAFYDFDMTSQYPTFNQISSTLFALPRYGLSLEKAAKNGTGLHKVIMELAFKTPLDMFSVVCYHQMEWLAVEISRILISVPLHNLTDDQCTLMGPIYLRRLLFLHAGRTERLKILLSIHPTKHPANITCDAIDQRKNMDTAWMSAVRGLAWEANADPSVSLLHTELSLVVERLNCIDCKTAVRERIREILVDWTRVKQTI